MMDGETAPRGIGGLGALGQRLDEIAMIELDREGYAVEILSRELERGLGEIDAVIMPNLGPAERRTHLPRVAASDVEKGKRLGQTRERAVENAPHLLMLSLIHI